MRSYYVYIMSSYSKVLYIGVTNNLLRRVYEHKNEVVGGFSSMYKTKYLVYYETTNSPDIAITREKQLKSWRREKKESLIRTMNPLWRDLYPDIASNSEESIEGFDDAKDPSTRFARSG